MTKFIFMSFNSRFEKLNAMLDKDNPDAMQLYRSLRKCYDQQNRGDDLSELFQRIYEFVSKRDDSYFTGKNQYRWFFLADYLLRHDPYNRRYVELVTHQLEKFRKMNRTTGRLILLTAAFIEKDFHEEAKHLLSNLFLLGDVERDTNGSVSEIKFLLQREKYFDLWGKLLASEKSPEANSYYVVSAIYQSRLLVKDEKEAREKMNAYFINNPISIKRQTINIIMDDYDKFKMLVSASFTECVQAIKKSGEKQTRPVKSRLQQWIGKPQTNPGNARSNLFTTAEQSMLTVIAKAELNFQ